MHNFMNAIQGFSISNDEAIARCFYTYPVLTYMFVWRGSVYYSSLWKKIHKKIFHDQNSDLIDLRGREIERSMYVCVP